MLLLTYTVQGYTSSNNLSLYQLSLEDDPGSSGGTKGKTAGSLHGPTVLPVAMAGRAVA